MRKPPRRQAAGSPTIYGPSPASGPPGATVLIFGANFANVTSVTFNGTKASYTWADGNRVYATVPAGATTGPISVTMPSGTATSAASFTVTPAPPTISAFTPTSGSVGTNVDIQGANLTGATDVTFNGTQANYNVDSDSHLHATVPAGAATGPISVTTAGGTATSSASLTVTTQVAATISAFTPTSGSAGTTVQIQGAGFTGATVVTFNGAKASSSMDSDSHLRATVPACAATGPISVTTLGGTAINSSRFTVPPPTISGLSSTYGRGGQQLTITGSNFACVTTVKLGTTSAKVTVNSSTRITAVVPPIAAGYYRWSVRTSSGTATNTSRFRVR
jgi:large repetitive protein